MSEEQNDPKKAFPSSFLFFLVAALLIILMVQSFVETKQANVSFSYQLEHLVNLQLIQPEQSRKTAVKENLVSFSGRFRGALPEEGKSRYKYLDLLNRHHELARDREDFEQEFQELRGKITEAADWYLHLSGRSIESGGFKVLSDVYTGSKLQPGILITNKSEKELPNLPTLHRNYDRLVADNVSATTWQRYGVTVHTFLQHLRSPVLGIGVQDYKEKIDAFLLKTTPDSLNVLAAAEHRQLYGQILTLSDEVLGSLEPAVDGTRLSGLRSIRNYKEATAEYQLLLQDLEENDLQLTKARDNVEGVIWYFNNRELSTRALERQDPEIYHHWFAQGEKEWENFPLNKGGAFRAPDQPLNLVLEKTFKSEEPPPNYFNYLFTLMPVILLVLVLYFLFARQMKGGGMGSGAMSFGKSPAKLLTKDQNKVTFKDVAGLEEATEELQEIVDFLKAPHKFTALGGRIPKGVLCVGPPGTGKTLIAKAVAGEADRPFFSISGSDFVEMFVGVGASRIRDMFNQAKKQAPCIIFMDEIDAVGRHRGAGIGGGHDEREQTLNQLLVEMDGFDSNDGVILMAATNRPDVLDKALLRPGRFDRRVVVNLPDIKGRLEILKVHARKIKLDESVDLMAVARSTPGSSGADLANLLNESALLAARKGRRAVTDFDVKEARDKVLYGKARVSMELDEDEKKTTAIHESGHAIVGLAVEHGDPVDKVTIIPRGMSLGATMFLPEKNKTSYWRKELVDRLAVLMGGRCAEDIFVGDVSSGAQKDIEQATALARSMVCEWGMSDKLGTVAYDERSESGQYLGMQNYHEKRYSEETARQIDEEVRRILDEANQRALDILNEHRELVVLMTDMLMEFETLDSVDIQKLWKKEWNVDEKRQRLKDQDEAHRRHDEEWRAHGEEEGGAEKDEPSQEERSGADPEASPA